MQVSQVYASWTRTGYTQPWDNVASPSLLSHKGWNVDPAFANFTYGHIGNLEDGQGIQLNYTVTIKGDRREWYWWEGTKRFYFALGLHGSGGSGYALFYIGHEQGIIIRTSEAKVGTQLQYNVGKPFPTTIGETVDTDNALWYIQLIRLNSTTLKVVYATNLLAGGSAELEEYVEGALKTFTETLTVDPSVWENPELVLYVGHDGSGEFSVSFADPYIGTIAVLEDQAPPKLSNPFQWVTDAFNFLYQIALIVGSFMGFFIPILPFIFLFYLLDVIITSVQVGSVQPIGKFALMIWDFLLKIWDVLVKFGQLIWDAITFWT
ncbi:MAG: hypothetical protein NWF09_09880 [Candidatus Bathyarchaeota archaeon]|nr:hypothetical protein [Candidatus Bathyarchaeota archaeon]